VEESHCDSLDFVGEGKQGFGAKRGTFSRLIVISSPKQAKQQGGASANPRLAKRDVRRSRRSPPQKRKDYLDDLFAQVADAIYVHDLNGRMLDANPAACQIFGFPERNCLPCTLGIL
jgi:PAS domain-containing protein